MELKPQFCLICLLLLRLAGPLPAALAGEASAPAAVEDQGHDAADWNRDLFAIFRGDPEVKNSTGPGKPAKAAKTSGPLPGKVADQGTLLLQGIVASDGAFVALVDGRVVRTGETVSGWKVRRITRHGVMAEGPGGVREFELLAENPRARVSSSSGGP